MSARGQVLAEPRHGCGAGPRKLFLIRIKVSPFYRCELLRLQHLLVSAQLQISQGDVVGESDNYQQWSGRDPGGPPVRTSLPADLTGS